MKRSLEVLTKKDSSQSLIKDMNCLIMSFILIVAMSGIFENSAHAQTAIGNAPSTAIIKDGDEWRYFKGITKPPSQWNRNGFDDSSWLKGPSGFGYGRSSYRTILPDMQGRYKTVYARKDFIVNDIYEVTGMTLAVVCDGPFVAYLNGIEVIQNNSVNTNDQSIVTPQAEELDISGFTHELFPGKNGLYIECTNDEINSNGFSFSTSFEVHVYQGGNVK